MHVKQRYIVMIALLFFFSSDAQQKTYCNPINLDYGYTPIADFAAWGKHRATADPVIVNYKGDYYLFSTNQWGYWWSNDMLNWKFIAKKFLRPWNTGTYDELCVPAVGIIGDTMIVFGSTYTSQFTIWMSTNPKANEWKPLVDSFEIGGWDPSFFADDDGRLYLYNGTRKEIYLLETWRFGWQQFGEHMDNTFLDPFIEGSYMTKYNGKYFLQYGAPGTGFSGYADGLLTGDHPLVPFLAMSDPLSMKLGGFVRGAWHVSTTVLSVKNTFERRLGIWPAGFDTDGWMYCNTSFGDYPHYLPGTGHSGSSYGNAGKSDYFSGWMLLNYKKPVQVSSTLGGYHANQAVDELAKTYWSAATSNKGEWIQTDLGNIFAVHAVQINYADQDAEFLGKPTTAYHQYKMYYSADGKKWKVPVDNAFAYNLYYGTHPDI